MLRTLFVFPLKKELKIFKEQLIKSKIELNPIQANGVMVHEWLRQNKFFAAASPGDEAYYQKCKKIVELVKPEQLICIGSAGALDNLLHIGDIIGASNCLEIIKNGGAPKVRQYKTDDKLMSELKLIKDAKIELGSILSVDGNVFESQQAEKLVQLTSARAVAQEGAAGCRVANEFNLKFVELRAITDFANEAAEEDFHNNIEWAMINLAKLIVDWQ